MPELNEWLAIVALFVVLPVLTWPELFAHSLGWPPASTTGRQPTPHRHRNAMMTKRSCGWHTERANCVPISLELNTWSPLTARCPRHDNSATDSRTPSSLMT